ncbi:sulfotransferase [Spirillospora sp. CA-255316]
MSDVGLDGPFPGGLGLDGPPDRPVFIIGCPRSGTTLLQLMLHSHPRIAIPAENRFLLAAYTSRCEFGDLGDRENRRALAEWITGREEGRFGDLGLDAAAVTEEIVAGPPTLGSALGIVFRAYAHRFGKPRWGDKRPGYFRYADTLLRLFPDAQFVHLIRDGRDCVASLKEMPWFRKDVYHAMAMWREAIDAGRRLAERAGPDTYYELQYERLVADPVEELSSLCEFLGEDFDPAMIEPQEIAPRVVPSEKVWHDLTRSPVGTAHVGAWAGRLEPWEAGLAELAFGERLAEYGYEPSDEAERPSARQLATFRKISVHRRLAHRKAEMQERRRRRREPNPVRCLLPATAAPGIPPAATAPHVPAPRTPAPGVPAPRAPEPGVPAPRTPAPGVGSPGRSEPDTPASSVSGPGVPAPGVPGRGV